MATEHSTHANVPVDRGPGYERRDANVRSLLQFGFWMALVIFVTLIAMRFTFNYFARVLPLGPQAAPFLDAKDRPLPPSPRLQVLPHEELRDYCAAQNAAVNGYGWVNKAAGVVRVPIDRAMDLTLERGLPSRPASSVPTGSAAPNINPPNVSGENDMKGQCAYVTEPVNSAGGATEEPKD